MQRLHANPSCLGNRAHLERILIMHDHDVLICDYSACPWSSALSFRTDDKALLTLSARAIERNFPVPIPGHVDLDFGAITPRRIRALDRAAGVHLHSGHIHIHVELHVADIDKLTVAIAKFDQHFVVALAERSFAPNEIYRQVVDVLGEEWRAGDLCCSHFLPCTLSAIKNRDHGDDQRDPFEQTLTIFARYHQRRRKKWSLFFFLLLFQTTLFPDHVNHWIDQKI